MGNKLHIFDKESELMKALDEHLKRVEAVRKLPAYQEFIKYKEELELFSKFIDSKRREKTKELILDLIQGRKDEEIKAWIERIKKLEKRLSDSEWKKGYSFCSSNIMDHVWETVKEIGEEVDVDDMFGNAAYKIGKFTMESYSGQGEYGYAIYVNQRIF